MQRIAGILDGFSNRLGQAVSWIALLMVLTQFTVVIMRYVFGVGSVMMQESIIYMHSLVFMLAAGYTLLHDEHVRVDIFYREASPKYKAVVNLTGTVLFLWPMCWLIWDAAYPYVSLSWTIREGSMETSGIPAIYLLKSVILVFTVLVALQGLSLAIHAIRTLLGRETIAQDAPPKF
ncbi:TRAP transporter small permease subunit [Tepidicaulis sp. LMO-SS28]|uniref:TRAP transporter small permease subunit n=1 Tax=Tepidicaulis sp. LMO-SS28 TaxID=3447455 RepID=UPI003EDE8811